MDVKKYASATHALEHPPPHNPNVDHNDSCPSSHLGHDCREPLYPSLKSSLHPVAHAYVVSVSASASGAPPSSGTRSIFTRTFCVLQHGRVQSRKIFFLPGQTPVKCHHGAIGGCAQRKRRPKMNKSFHNGYISETAAARHSTG